MLDRILSGIESGSDPRVLVGFNQADDAGVYLLDEETALIQTVDFFTPIVDDPFVFGQIAAANSLSDVYAMGGTPLTALTILAVSTAIIPEEDVREMVRGGSEKMKEAGVPVIGGHSIRDKEAKLGYSVSGLAHPQHIYRNSGACPGDFLLLTKPLGTGVVSTAVKADMAEPEVEEETVKWMCALNRIDPDILSAHEVHAITDITGFGLVGHSLEMARASGVYITIKSEEVPLIKGARSLAEQGFLPGGISANREFYSCAVEFGRTDEVMQSMFYDPQTSGGLLVSLSSSKVRSLEEILLRRGFPARIIGEVNDSGRKRLEFI